MHCSSARVDRQPGHPLELPRRSAGSIGSLLQALDFSLEKQPWLSSLIELQATARPRAGKGAAHQARREGKVPAVIYGDSRTASRSRSTTTICGSRRSRATSPPPSWRSSSPANQASRIPRDMQVDPIMDRRSTSTSMRIGKDGRIRVEVRLIHQRSAFARPEAWRRAQHRAPRRRGLSAPTTRCPPFFEVGPLTGLEIGRSIHISAVLDAGGHAEPTIQVPRLHLATIAGAREAGRGNAGLLSSRDTVTAAAPAAGGKAPAAAAAAPAGQGAAAERKGPGRRCGQARRQRRLRWPALTGAAPPVAAPVQRLWAASVVHKASRARCCALRLPQRTNRSSF